MLKCQDRDYQTQFLWLIVDTYMPQGNNVEITFNFYNSFLQVHVCEIEIIHGSIQHILKHKYSWSTSLLIL